MNLINNIQETIDYIERSLFERLDLDALSQKAHLSKYYYHRTFQAMVGYPVHRYIKKRRLTEGAKKLRLSDDTVTRIAHDCGYFTPAAFSRAFFNEFALAPTLYRKGRSAAALCEKVNLIGRTFTDQKSSVTLGPSLQKMEPKKFVGIRLQFEQGSLNGYIPPQTVIKAFEDLQARISLIPNKLDENMKWGRCCFDASLGKRVYFAGIEVSRFGPIPEGMGKMSIPETEFAIFRHNNDFALNRYTLGYVYKTWFPESGYAFDREAGLLESFYGNPSINKDIKVVMRFAVT